MSKRRTLEIGSFLTAVQQKIFYYYINRSQVNTQIIARHFVLNEQQMQDPPFIFYFTPFRQCMFYHDTTEKAWNQTLDALSQEMIRTIAYGWHTELVESFLLLLWMRLACE